MLRFSMGYDSMARRAKSQPQVHEIVLLTARDGVLASGLGRDRDMLSLTVTAPARLAGDYRVEVTALNQGPLCLVSPVIQDPDGSGAALLAECGLWACNAELGEAVIAGQWLRDGQAVAGQTGAVLEPGPIDAGRTIGYSESVGQSGRTAIAISAGFSIPPEVQPVPETEISAVLTPAEAQTFGGDRIGGIVAIATYRDVANYVVSNDATVASVAVEVNGTPQDDAFTLNAGDVVSLCVTASDGTIRRWALSTTRIANTGPIALASRAYPTGFGTITQDIAAQIPGAEKAVSWSVEGAADMSIDNAGLLSFNSDAIPAGSYALTGTATGADNETWTLTVTFEAIAFSYDGTDISSFSYPADTPVDLEISFTATGGEQDGREISFTPANLAGLADGEGFAALAPIIAIASDGGTAAQLDAGDVIDLQVAALYLYGQREPEIAYSAYDDTGLIAADISFPWTVPSSLSGTLTIIADDGFGNRIASKGLAIHAAASSNLEWWEPLAHADLDYENDRARIDGISYPSIATARAAGAIVVNANGVDTVPFMPAASYTIAGKGVTPAGVVNGYVACTDDGTDGNATDHLVTLGQTNASTVQNPQLRWSFGAFVGGSATLNRFADTMESAVAFRTAFKVKPGGSVTSLNGVTLATHTATSLPVVTHFNARNRADGQRLWGGTVNRLLLINQDIDETTVNGLLA